MRDAARENLLKSVATGERLAEFANDPAVKEYFQLEREFLMGHVLDSSVPHDRLTHTVASLRALDDLENWLKGKVASGARAEKTLQEKR